MIVDAVAGRVHHPAVAEVDAGVVDLGRLRLRPAAEEEDVAGLQVRDVAIRFAARDLAGHLVGRAAAQRVASAPPPAYDVSL